MSRDRCYLGDSVYVEIADESIKLYIDNGDVDSPKNIIFMYPSVVVAFTEWLEAKALRDKREECQDDRSG